MGNPEKSRKRVDAALHLVRRQREIVAECQVGSPAHRQASDVLALIEESHFLLSELHRISAASVDVEAVGPVEPATKDCTPHTIARKRLPVGLTLAFFAALVAAAVFLEIADPAPMDVEASVFSQKITSP